MKFTSGADDAPILSHWAADATAWGPFLRAKRRSALPACRAIARTRGAIQNCELFEVKS